MMRPLQAVENLRESLAPDCTTCALRKGCEMFQENSFCTRWRSRDPEPKGPNPNEQWERGEDSPFN